MVQKDYQDVNDKQIVNEHEIKNIKTQIAFNDNRDNLYVAGNVPKKYKKEVDF